VAESLRPSLGQQEVQLQPSIIANKAVPIRGSSSQWTDNAKSESMSDYDFDYGTDGAGEYDSAELLDSDDELQERENFNEENPNKETVVASDVLEDDHDDDDVPAEVLSAFGLGLPAGPALAIASTQQVIDSKSVHVPSNKFKPPPASPPAPDWKRYMHLLAPHTPPGKRIIKPEDQLPVGPKSVDNHRVSYGLTAASVYARLQPSLRQQNNGTYRQKVVPRPYKRRPITPSSTPSPSPNLPTVEDQDELIDREESIVDEEEEMLLEDEDDDGQEEEIEFKADAGLPGAELEDEEDGESVVVQERPANRQEEPEEEEEELPIESIKDDQKKEEEEEDEDEKVAEEIVDEQQPELSPRPPQQPKTSLATTPSAVLENETVKEPIAVDPVDIKNLLRSAGPLSLSEILQQKGLSLAELLKGGSKLAPVIGISSGTSTDDVDKLKSTEVVTSTTTTTTPASTTKKTPIPTTSRPAAAAEIPSVQSISLRELLKAKNITLQEVIQPPSTPSSTLLNGPTLKPGVKMPVPFSAARAKGLAGLVAFSNSTDTADNTADSSTNEPITSAPKPADSTKSFSQLKPLIFGSGGTAAVPTTSISTTTSKPQMISPIAGILVAYGDHIDIDGGEEPSSRPATTGLIIKAKRPYMAGTMVGEYGQHAVIDEDDDEEESGEGKVNKTGLLIPKTVYGLQRPIATSRLTPAPPRKQRPVANFNYNDLAEFESSQEEDLKTTTATTILTHFNEEELIEVHPYFNLPMNVQHAIIVSSSIGGFSLAVFIIILIIFKIKQKTRIRLRHPTALLSAAVNIASNSGGSDSSGITTPVSHAASKSGGYAKLPARSSSLWGTLRRSVRQMESANYS